MVENSQSKMYFVYFIFVSELIQVSGVHWQPLVFRSVVNVTHLFVEFNHQFVFISS